MKYLFILFLNVNICLGQTFSFNDIPTLAQATVAASGAPASVDNTVRYVQAWWTNIDAAAVSASIAIAPTVSANSVVVVYVKNETAQTASSCTNSAGVAFTAATQKTHANNDLHGRFFYQLGATAATNLTVVFSSSAATFKRVEVFYGISSTPPVFDTESVNSGTGTAISSGNLTPVGAGLVLGGYSEYSGGTLSGLLIGTNSGVNIPDNEPSFNTRMWAVQTSGTNTVAATATLSASGAWVCNAIAFKGTGLDSTTGTNYAHFYEDMTNQTRGATASGAIGTNGAHGTISGITFTPATPTGLIVGLGDVNKTSPVWVNGTVYNVADASGCWDITNTVTGVYIQNAISDHRQLTISGFVKIGPTNGGSVAKLFDMVRIETSTPTALFAIIQLDKSTYNLSIESTPNIGGTTHSTGFTATPGATYKYSMLVDFHNFVCKWTVWDTSGTVMVSESAIIGNGTDQPSDITSIKRGQVEFGTSAGTSTKLYHTMWSFMPYVYPMQP